MSLITDNTTILGPVIKKG